MMITTGRLWALATAFIPSLSLSIFLPGPTTKYGYFDKSNPSQFIVVSKDPTDPSIIRFLEEKGYDTIREKLKSSRMNIILKLIISFLVVVAA